MSKGFITPLWTDSESEQFFEYFNQQAEEKIYMLLSSAGEKYIEIARKTGTYQNRTANLRSSIGYILFKRGSIVEENFEKSGGGTDGETGIEAGRRLAKEVASEIGLDYVLVFTAGMEYAAHVEAKGYDVATNGAMLAENYLRETSKKLFEKLSKR